VAYDLGNRTALIVRSTRLYAFDPYATASGINSPGLNAVRGFILEQNYPNPFDQSTTIRYSLLKQADVSLKIYDLTGREVRVLVDQRQVPGGYSVIWNGRVGNEHRAEGGIYIYRLTAGQETLTMRMVMAGKSNIKIR
jgi:hypothetical protein